MGNEVTQGVKNTSTSEVFSKQVEQNTNVPTVNWSIRSC